MSSKWKVADEIEDASRGEAHFVLLGAGASKAAMPDGDKFGRDSSLLRSLGADLGLYKKFPKQLQDLARSDFELAYSKLTKLKGQERLVQDLNMEVIDYYSKLKIPDEPNLYDILVLSLRGKDVIATFNWDPFLLQAYLRCSLLLPGVEFPKLYFLHGNVEVGVCYEHKTSGYIWNGCSRCGKYENSQLLYPVGDKDYTSDKYVASAWSDVRNSIKRAKFFTVFGYSAPESDQGAVDLLKNAWGDVNDRSFEQFEIIGRPGSDVEELRSRWNNFIHTHHFEVHSSFFDSWIVRHPRRSIEAFWQQYMEAMFIEDHTVPPLDQFEDIGDLADWFRPLIKVESDEK